MIAKRACSLLMKAANSSAVLVVGEVACVPIARISSGDAAALRISTLSFCMTAAGVPAGARMPFHSAKAGDLIRDLD